MNQLQLFLPCAAGVEDYLTPEVLRITGLPPGCVTKQRGGVAVRTSLAHAMLLNLHSRLAQRVLVLLSYTPYRNEQDLYRAASEVAWEHWFTPRESIKIEVTAQHSPLTSLNFAEGDDDLKPLYDPCCGSGTIVIEAAQMACNIAAGSRRRFAFEKYVPFQRHVWDAIKKEASDAEVMPQAGQRPIIFGSDVAHRMVDFAQRNAERAGVAKVIEFRGGDALQRLPPVEGGGVMLLNPPYGERIEVAGVARSDRTARPRHQGISASSPDSERASSYEEDSDSTAEGSEQRGRFGARELPQMDNGGEFFGQLASHWKKNYSGWTAWMLTPDLKLPGKMRLKESRRVPMWNGPIECRLFRFDMVAGSARPQPVKP